MSWPKKDVRQTINEAVFPFQALNPKIVRKI